MRNFIVGLSLFACFFAFYCAGAYLRSYPLAPTGTMLPLPALVTRQAVKVPETPDMAAVQPAAGSAPLKPLSDSLEEDQGATLAARLRPRLDPFSRIAPSLQKRFGASYPPTEHAYTREAASRLTILQAMDTYTRRAMPQTELMKLTDFYQQTAARETEHPMVRRQSYRNLLKISSRLDEKSRLQVLARVPDRAIASAAHTDTELLHDLFRGGTR